MRAVLCAAVDRSPVAVRRTAKERNGTPLGADDRQNKVF